MALLSAIASAFVNLAIASVGDWGIFEPGVRCDLRSGRLDRLPMMAARAQCLVMGIVPGLVRRACRQGREETEIQREG